MLWDTTASYTGGLNEACVLLKYKFERELLLVACRTKYLPSHWKSAISLLKNIKDNWKNIDDNEIQKYIDFRKHYFDDLVTKKLPNFYVTELKIAIVGNVNWSHYLSYFWTIWMARIIYSLKICSVQNER